MLLNVLIISVTEQAPSKLMITYLNALRYLGSIFAVKLIIGIL